MYIVSSLWLPEANVLRCQSYNITLIVHDTGSGTTSTHIDTDIVVDLRVEFIARVCRQLSRLLALVLSERN
jgi:hypothetical protein